ncbi:MAG: 30S ribosomal protein S4 [bacterium]
MARNLDPQCKRCRREGEKLFLKGERCFSPKCAIIKRNYPPGVHGQTGRGRKISEYGRQLREKQKAKNIYGILESQMRKYYEEAAKGGGVTGSVLMQILESRIDNVVFRLGFADSRTQARQLVNHGHIEVDGKKVKTPSFQVKSGMQIKVREISDKKNYFIKKAKEQEKDVPSWLIKKLKKLEGEVKNLPTKKDLEYNIDTQLIVEYYSR